MVFFKRFFRLTTYIEKFFLLYAVELKTLIQTEIEYPVSRMVRTIDFSVSSRGPEVSKFLTLSCMIASNLDMKIPRFQQFSRRFRGDGIMCMQKSTVYTPKCGRSRDSISIKMSHSPATLPGFKAECSAPVNYFLSFILHT